MPLKPEDLVDHVQECMTSPPDDGRLHGRRLLRQRLKDEGVAAYNRQLPLRERNDRAHAVINNMYHQALDNKEPVISNILRHGDAFEKAKPPIPDSGTAAKAVQVVPASLDNNGISDPPQRADPANPQVAVKLAKGAFFDPNSGVEKRNTAIGTSGDSNSTSDRRPASTGKVSGAPPRPFVHQKAAGLESRAAAVDTSTLAPPKPHTVVHPMDAVAAKRTVPKPAWATHKAAEANTELKSLQWDKDLLTLLPKVGSLHPAFQARGALARQGNSPRPVTARMANRPKDTIGFLF